MYEKLKACLVERGMSRKDFAGKLGLSESALSARFNGNTGWTIKDIKKASEVLDIKSESIGPYFFT